MKTIKTIIWILTLCALNQFANAQSCNNSHPCPFGYHCVNHVCVADAPSCNLCQGGCGFICVKHITCGSSQYYYYLSHGWHTCPFNRLSGSEEIQDKNTIGIFPNPVTNSVTISFTLATQQKATLRILDLSGRLITTLADNIFEEGVHQVDWNIADTDAGMYLVCMNNGSYSETQKLSVVK